MPVTSAAEPTSHPNSLPGPYNGATGPPRHPNRSQNAAQQPVQAETAGQPVSFHSTSLTPAGSQTHNVSWFVFAASP